MKWLKQPSTWRGFFILAGILGFKLEPELQDAITTAVLAALALIEVIRNEHAPAPVNIQLPPIDLQGKSTSVVPNHYAGGFSVDQLRQPVSPDYNPKEPTAPKDYPTGWNG